MSGFLRAIGMITTAASARDTVVPGSPAADAPQTFEEVENIAEAITYIADHHGKTIQVPALVPLREMWVRVLSTDEMSPEAEWAAFLSMLEVNGLEAESSGDEVNLVPIRQ